MMIENKKKETRTYIYKLSTYIISTNLLKIQEISYKMGWKNIYIMWMKFQTHSLRSFRRGEKKLGE